MCIDVPSEHTELVLRFCATPGLGGITQVLRVPTPQLKKHLGRRSSHRCNRAHCTSTLVSAPQSSSLSCLVQRKPPPGWPQTQMARSLAQISFTTENRGWGWGNLPSWGNMSRPVNSERRALLPCSASQLHSLC